MPSEAPSFRRHIHKGASAGGEEEGGGGGGAAFGGDKKPYPTAT
ncbi:hypothetical protein AB1Q13_001959 [Neisseria gonorrhoeae]|nr:hypothetical protein [Neisseria gonorrhoeae]